MNHSSRLVRLTVVLSVMAVCGPARNAPAKSNASSGIPTPASVIGHPVGADYKLARWEKIVEYLELLGSVSDRVNVRRICTTTEGKPHLLIETSRDKTRPARPRAKKQHAAQPGASTRLTTTAKLVSQGALPAKEKTRLNSGPSPTAMG